MLSLMIPGRGSVDLAHLVCDMNGTLAEDGDLLDGVIGRLVQLGKQVQVHILTADTHGTAARNAELLRVACVAADTPTSRWERVVSGSDKEAYVRELGAEHVVALGNGANDELMLRVVGLGIAIIGSEGAFVPALLAADIVMHSPLDALDLLLSPERLIATWRR